MVEEAPGPRSPRRESEPQKPRQREERDRDRDDHRQRRRSRSPRRQEDRRDERGSGRDRDRPREDRPREDRPREDRHREDKPRDSRRGGGGGGFKWKEKRPENTSEAGGEKRLERGYRKRSRSPRRDRDKKPSTGAGNSVEDKFGVSEKFGASTKSSSSNPNNNSSSREKENTDQPPQRAAAAPSQVSHGEAMIIVHVNDRLGTKAAIPCLASDPIKLFKAQVAARIGRKPHEILLKRQGERPFKDQLTLEDYGVGNGVQIDLEIDTGE